MDWNAQISSPYYYLVIGAISLVAGAIFTCTGKAYGRYAGWVSRVKEPTEFWWRVALYYIGGVFFIAIFLYKVYEHSN